MTDCFGLFYISESKNHGFVFEKQIKIRELSDWVIPKHRRTSSFQETTGKEPTVRKTFFWKISKKLRTKVLHQNPNLDFFFTPAE